VDSADYCAAERLLWSFDDANNILELLHTRSLFNCAAKLDIEIIDTNGSYKIIENDTSSIKARCMCYRDTYYEIYDIISPAISIVIEGKSFSLDLRDSNGAITLDTIENWPCF